METEELVHAFAVDDGGDNWSLASIRDERGNYRLTAPPDSMKDALRLLYLTNAPNGTAVRFDLAWPAIWDLTEYVAPSRSLVAIIDSGLMHEHPLLKGLVKESVDFTGEGIEDRNGHGTNVALIARSLVIGRPEPFLIILKVLDEHGMATPDVLIRALDWITDYNCSAPETERIFTATLSGGVYSRRFKVLPCNGHCTVCEAARRAAPTGGMLLQAAAGNTAGRTACPARAGLDGSCNVIAVGSSTENLGRGTLATPTGQIRVDNQNSAIARAAGAFEAGEYGLAATIWDELIAAPGIDPAISAELQLNRAQALANLGQLDEAVHDIDLLDAGSSHADDATRDFAAKAMYLKAHLLSEGGRPTEAIAADDELLQRFGNATLAAVRYYVAAALFDKGNNEERLGQNDEEVATLDELLRRFRDALEPEIRVFVAQALYNKGNALRRLQRFRESIDAYDESLQRAQTAAVGDAFIRDATFNRNRALADLRETETPK